MEIFTSMVQYCKVLVLVVLMVLLLLLLMMLMMLMLMMLMMMVVVDYFPVFSSLSFFVSYLLGLSLFPHPTRHGGYIQPLSF